MAELRGRLPAAKSYGLRSMCGPAARTGASARAVCDLGFRITD